MAFARGFMRYIGCGEGIERAPLAWDTALSGVFGCMTGLRGDITKGELRGRYMAGDTGGTELWNGGRGWCNISVCARGTTGVGAGAGSAALSVELSVWLLVAVGVSGCAVVACGSGVALLLGPSFAGSTDSRVAAAARAGASTDAAGGTGGGL